MQNNLVHNIFLYAISKLNADWIINADADEFFYATSLDLKNYVCKDKVTTLKLKMYDIVPFNDLDQFFFKDNFFINKHLTNFEANKFSKTSPLFLVRMSHKSII